MKYQNLGGSGLKVSRICLGCLSYGVPDERHRWVLDENAGRQFIRLALENGINFFDTANMYSYGASEEILGRAIRDFSRREDVIIATKVFYTMRDDPNGGGLSRKAIMTEIDNSLRRLGTDYVDLYQLHRWDYGTPLEETLEALHDIVKAGKVRYLGASSMHAWRFCKALHVAEGNGWTRFISMQPHYNLLYREEEREMLGLCSEEGIGVIPWSPLARGRLARATRPEMTRRSETDKFGRSLYKNAEAADQAICSRVADIARSKNLPAATIALAWLLHKPVVTSPIIGATKLEHLRDAVGAVNVNLSREEMQWLEDAYVPHVPAGFD
jgi:aryl-alcohol dehydrogenase-like predicted oxidoreductase